MEITSDQVHCELHDSHIAVLQLQRPEKRNAITPVMVRELERLALRCEADPAVRVIVITGAGKDFCAGADLGAIAAGRAFQLRTQSGGFAGLVDLPKSKPWIAAVCGAAVAGGFEIVLSCDIIIAATDAVFGLPEVKRGLVATGGGVWRLPRALPRHVALELIASGESMSAQRAHTLGLVSEIVEPRQVFHTALAKARIIACNSPNAVRESLAIAREAASCSEIHLREIVRATRERVFRSKDATEGAKAFIERRDPDWS